MTLVSLTLPVTGNSLEYWLKVTNTRTVPILTEPKFVTDIPSIHVTYHASNTHHNPFITLKMHHLLKTPCGASPFLLFLHSRSDLCHDQTMCIVNETAYNYTAHSMRGMKQITFVNNSALSRLVFMSRPARYNAHLHLSHVSSCSPGSQVSALGVWWLLIAVLDS